jgi:hypothetical protein
MENKNNYIEFNIENYLDKDEIKECFTNALVKAYSNYSVEYGGKFAMSNIVHDAINHKINTIFSDYEKVLREKIDKLLSEEDWLSAFNITGYRHTDRWHQKSLYYEIVDERINQEKDRIQGVVSTYIDDLENIVEKIQNGNQDFFDEHNWAMDYLKDIIIQGMKGWNNNGK